MVISVVRVLLSALRTRTGRPSKGQTLPRLWAHIRRIPRGVQLGCSVDLVSRLRNGPYRAHGFLWWLIGDTKWTC